MAEIDPSSLAGFASWCALQAVATQRRFDDASVEPVAAIAPARWRIESFEIQAELGCTVSKSTQFGIQVNPINLGYRVARRYTAQADLRLSLTVEQRPLAPALAPPRR